MSHREKNGSNQSFDFIKDFKSSVKSLCDEQTRVIFTVQSHNDSKMILRVFSL